MRLLITFFTVAAITLMSFTNHEGLHVGDYAPDFKLKNIDGKMVALDDYKAAKGFIVIFTCNHCPYSQAYEDRIIALDKKYRDMGYPVIAINPNDPVSHPSDNYENMQKRAKEKGFTFPYLYDDTQNTAKKYGATRTPHVFFLEKESVGKFKVRYIGAIDNDTEGTNKERVNYLEDAIMAVDAGKAPNPDYTKAIGCTIKWKK